MCLPRYDGPVIKRTKNKSPRFATQATTAKRVAVVVRVFCTHLVRMAPPSFLSHRRSVRADSIEKPAGSLCCQKIMAVRIVNKVIGLRRAGTAKRSGDVSGNLLRYPARFHEEWTRIRDKLPPSPSRPLPVLGSAIHRKTRARDSSMNFLTRTVCRSALFISIFVVYVSFSYEFFLPFVFKILLDGYISLILLYDENYLLLRKVLCIFSFHSTIM